MEGPHGSGGPTPEKTVGWLWGFLYGSGFTALAIGVLWLVYRF